MLGGEENLSTMYGLCVVMVKKIEMFKIQQMGARG
jgi:hypothetical protein